MLKLGKSYRNATVYISSCDGPFEGFRQFLVFNVTINSGVECDCDASVVISRYSHRSKFLFLQVPTQTSYVVKLQGATVSVSNMKNTCDALQSRSSSAEPVTDVVYWLARYQAWSPSELIKCVACVNFSSRVCRDSMGGYFHLHPIHTT